MKVRLAVVISLAVALIVVVSLANEGHSGDLGETRGVPHGTSSALSEPVELVVPADPKTAVPEEEDGTCGVGNPHTDYATCFNPMLELCRDNDGTKDECCLAQDPPCTGPCVDADCENGHVYDQQIGPDLCVCYG